MEKKWLLQTVSMEIIDPMFGTDYYISTIFPGWVSGVYINDIKKAFPNSWDILLADNEPT